MTSESLKYFYSTDSTDFSVPRDFNVYSNSGVAYRKYTVRVNVHKENAEDFVWKKMTTDNALAGLVGMRAVALD